MMRRLSLSLCLCLCTAMAAAECTRDAAPAIPDGNTATLEDMQAGQQAIKAYVASANAYLECLDNEAAAVGEDDTDEAKAARLADYNATVDEQTSVAENFNKAVKAFKARN